jgi:hypothetical protein
MRTWRHERLYGSPQTKDSLRGGRGHVKGPGDPHLRREPLLSKALREEAIRDTIVNSLYYYLRVNVARGPSRPSFKIKARPLAVILPSGVMYPTAIRWWALRM